MDVDAHRMLAELDLRVSDEARAEILGAFGDALDPLDRLLYEIRVPRAAHGQQKFAMLHLLSRGLSDLLAGGHLAAHCYLPQAYSVLRPVLDSCDLIALFAQDADAAALWTTTDKGHKDFRPGDVRELLGRERHDPVHGHFSEYGSHPRFAAARTSARMRVAADDPQDRTVVIRTGPTWLEDHSTLLIWPFIFNLAAELTAAAQHLVPIAADLATAERAWLTAYSRCIDAVARGTSLALDGLGESADSPLRGVWEPTRDRIREWLNETGG